MLMLLLLAFILGYQTAKFADSWRDFLKVCRTTWLLKRYNRWSESLDYDQMSQFEKLQLYRELDTIEQLDKEGKSIDDILRRRLKREATYKRKDTEHPRPSTSRFLRRRRSG